MAFDTAGHKIMVRVLDRYPQKVSSAINRIYQDFIVFLKIENSTEQNVQEFGLIQWDNIAPVLFLFLMAAFAEILE